MYGPPNRTEAWQPVDAGHIGQTVKILAQSVLSNWLELDSIHTPGEHLQIIAGVAIGVDGTNDKLIQVPGYYGTLNIKYEKSSLDDALQYGKKSWSRIPDFEYTNKIPNDEKDEELDLPSSSSESSSESSSTAD